MAGISTSAKDGTLTLNKTAKSLQEIAGIDIFADRQTGQVKDMVTILDELQAKWHTFTEEEQLGLANAIAGKQQASAFQALMVNFKTFKQMQEDFANNNHIGSMTQENERYINSLAGKLNHLKEVWVSIGTTIVNSDFTYSLLDGVIALSEGIEKVVKVIDELGITFPTVVTLFGALTSTLKKSNSITSIVDVFGGINKEMTITGKLTSTLSSGLSRGVGLLANFVKQGLLIGGVTVLVSGLAKSWDYFKNRLENTKKELEEVEKTQIETLNANKNKLNVLETTGRKYEELANKAEKTAEEEAEMLKLGNELAEVLPSIKIGTDEEGNAIISMTNNMEGYIDSVKEAINQQEKLLLGTRIEQLDNNIELLKKGNKEKSKVQEDYNKALEKNKKNLLSILEVANESEATEIRDKNQEVKKLLQDRLDIEAKYSAEYAEKQENIIKIAQETKQGIDTLWKDSLDKLVITEPIDLDKLKQSIQDFSNALNFNNLAPQDNSSIKEIFREIPELVQQGSLDIQSFTKKLQEINNEFAKDGNAKKYNSSIKELAEEFSKVGNWDIVAITKLFDKISDSSLEGATALDRFLESFGKTRKDLINGDDFAKGLQAQFDNMNQWIQTILDRDVGDITVAKELVFDLKTDEKLPDKLRGLIRRLDNLGVDKEFVLTLATDIMLDLQDDGFLNEFDNIKLTIMEALEEVAPDGVVSEEVKLQINGYLEGLSNKNELKQQVKNEVKKTVDEATTGATTEAKVKSEAKVEVTTETTIDVNSTENTEQTKKAVEEINKGIDEIENKDVNLSVNKGELQGSVEDFNKLIEYSSKLKDGEYSITFKSDSTEAVNQINNLTQKINELSGSIGKIGSLNIVIETAQGAKNVTGLKTRINEYLELSKKVKTLTFKTETAQASKNVTGLINKINSYLSVAKKVKPITFQANTAQAAKNITGLINKINSFVNKYSGKTFSTTLKTVQTQSKVEPKLVSSTRSISSITPKVNDGIQTLSEAPTNTTDTVSTLDSDVSIVNAPSTRITRALSASSALDYFKFDVNPFEDLEIALDKITEKLDLVSKKAEDAFGEKKLRLLEEEKTLLLEQQRILQNKTKDLLTYQNELKYSLMQQGIKFNGDDISNYQSKLLSLEKQIESLNNQKDALSGEGTESKSKALENQIKSLEELKRKMEEYIDVSSDMSSVTSELYEVTQAMNQLREDTIKTKEALYNFDIEIEIGEIQIELSKIQRELKGIDREIDNAFGQEKIDLINKKIATIKQEQQEVHKLANQYREQAKYYGEFLNSKGFIIHPDGQIGNLEILKGMQDSGVYETIVDYIEKYHELINEKIPDLSEEWWNLQDSVGDCSDEIKEFEEQAKKSLISVRDLIYDLRIDILEGQLKDIRYEQEKIDRLLDKSSSYGNQIKLHNEKLKLLEEERNKLNQIANIYEEQANTQKKILYDNGFKFDKEGNVTNLDHINDFVGKENFDEIQDALKEYVNLSSNLIPSANQDWEKMQWEIQDTVEEIKKLQEEQRRLIEESKYKVITDSLKDLSNEYDILQKKLKHASGTNKIILLEREIELLKEQKKVIEEQYKFLQDKKKVLQKDLSSLGFTFDENGDITNYVDNLTKLSENNDNFEDIQKTLEEYFAIQDDELPKLQGEWLDYDNAIKDALKEQLNVTKDVQDKIMDIYKKQLEERKKLIDEELDKRLDSLEKEKQAYLDYRAEADYKDDYEEQLSKVMELQKKLEIAAKDNSLAGQKKYQDLLKELQEAQKDLEDLVQDKIDSDIMDKFEDEADRLEDEANDYKDNLDEEYSDEKLQELVDKVINTGIFEGIDGELRNLNDVIVEYIDKYEDGMSAIGNIIKDEWLTNLNVAKETMGDMVDIIDRLELNGMTNSTPNLARSVSGYTNKVSDNSLNITSPLINIEGNVDKNVMQDLEKVSKYVLNKLVNEYR